MSKDPQEQAQESADQSFADILNEFEKTHAAGKKSAASKTKNKVKGKGRSSGPPPLRGTVVGVSGDVVLVDYGGKAEGLISSADLLDAEGKLSVKRGDTFDDERQVLTPAGYRDESADDGANVA